MNYIGIVIVVGIVLISNGCGTVGKSFNTSKIEIYGSGIKNKKQRIGKIEENFMNGFYIQLINDSTLRITEKDGNVFEYRKVY